MVHGFGPLAAVAAADGAKEVMVWLSTLEEEVVAIVGGWADTLSTFGMLLDDTGATWAAKLAAETLT